MHEGSLLGLDQLILQPVLSSWFLVAPSQPPMHEELLVP